MVTSMNPDFWRAMEKLLRLRENEKLDGVEFIQRDGAQYIEVVGHFSFKERIQRGSGPGNKEGTQASREAGDLTYKQLVEACRNIGFDLTCGACAELFYAGHPNPNHDEGCKTLERREP
jgi:hypothetical protein